MTLDVGLIANAKKAIAAKPRKYITPAILLAVIMQESGGCCYFLDLKSASQFKMNVYGAMAYNKKDSDGKINRIYTGFNENNIRNMSIIDPKIQDFIVNKQLVGKIAKFRFEPTYWEKYSHLVPETRFIFSCSWGLPQFMGSNISKVLDDIGALYIKRWRADIALQLETASTFIDELLEQSKGDVNRMYRGYNSGDINSTSPEVIYRADAVEKSDHVYQLQLGE
jgi:hypothetical protein